LDYNTDKKSFSPLLTQFIDEGVKWKDAEEMENSLSLKELSLIDTIHFTMESILDYNTDKKSFSPLLTQFIDEGVKWKDAEEMQNSLSLKEKGWLKDVTWKKSYIDNVCIGLGLFANEDIKEGEVIRRGELGKNVMHITPTKNLPKLNKPTLEYMRNYTHKMGGDPVGEEAMLCFVPGCSFNHSTKPTMVFGIRKMERNVVASRDVKKGEELTIDYEKFGPKPEWYPQFLFDHTGDRTCVLKGENDYV